MSSVYTVFCQQADGTGTIWIDSVQAGIAEEAGELGRINCAADWRWELEDVRLLGVADGDVQILIWEDLA